MHIVFVSVGSHCTLELIFDTLTFAKLILELFSDSLPSCILLGLVEIRLRTLATKNRFPFGNPKTVFTGD